LEIVDSRNRKTLEEVIQRRVDLHSTIVTNQWRSYNHLPSLGCDHIRVNHSKNFVNPDNPQAHTQTIESMWRCLRRFLNTKGSYSRRYLKEYLWEFMFRRGMVVDAFVTFVTGLAACQTITLPDTFPINTDTEDSIVINETS
jgi:hypothetical protein